MRRIERNCTKFQNIEILLKTEDWVKYRPSLHYVVFWFVLPSQTSAGNTIQMNTTYMLFYNQTPPVLFICKCTHPTFTLNDVKSLIVSFQFS